MILSKKEKAQSEKVDVSDFAIWSFSFKLEIEEEELSIIGTQVRNPC